MRSPTLVAPFFHRGVLFLTELYIDTTRCHGLLVSLQTAEPRAPCNNLCYADEILTRLPLVPLASLCHADGTESRWRFLWPCAYSCSKLSAGPLRRVLKGLMCLAGFHVSYCTFLCNMHVWPPLSSSVYLHSLDKKKCEMDLVLWWSFTLPDVCSSTWLFACTLL